MFCRGAVWMPVDPVSLAPPADEVRATLELAKAANLNLIRLPGTGVYQDEFFWDACDELGILVWQECMLAFSDPPDEPAFVSELESELDEQFELISGRPSLALICGSQEIEEQAAMNSVPRARWDFPVLERNIPDLVDQLLPGVPYVTSNPTGGTVPYQMDSGVSQYFGIGGYLRPVEDARRARVRFAAECLAFATPPERRTVDEECGGAYRAGHDPSWKLAVHHDAGTFVGPRGHAELLHPQAFRRRSVRGSLPRRRARPRPGSCDRGEAVRDRDERVAAAGINVLGRDSARVEGPAARGRLGCGRQPGQAEGSLVRPQTGALAGRPRCSPTRV